MNPEEFARTVFEPIITGLDEIITGTIDVYDELPCSPDGQITDPYERGCLDGALAIAQSFRAGLVQAMEQAGPPNA